MGSLGSGRTSDGWWAEGEGEATRSCCLGYALSRTMRRSKVHGDDRMCQERWGMHAQKAALAACYHRGSMVVAIWLLTVAVFPHEVGRGGCWLVYEPCRDERFGGWELGPMVVKVVATSGRCWYVCGFVTLSRAAVAAIGSLGCCVCCCQYVSHWMSLQLYLYSTLLLLLPAICRPSLRPHLHGLPHYCCCTLRSAQQRLWLLGCL